ncbi:MAG: HD domain-containing protein [Sphingobacteriales bacterium]|jgi:poly(A) polymerase|nr:HD domain-containing protein [Sphingobacteriales bacterium]MBP9141800.1 HD domain-containing protein [Chitinophagales bacterium]MDA0199024.1 HD domain-containing protein [Bacteroidota bacterium]MBK7527975.1 HD domain-containing protein [Sphingobacteriales bacterium]MBK8678964.1 HD domain-containing protein [Sphingobacteriales bacterium]
MLFNFIAEHQSIIAIIAQAAQQLNTPAWLVGGYVRDNLLNRPCKDIDVVCVGSGIELAKTAAALLPNATQVAIFANFGTAMFKINDYDLEVEFVGARRESYDRQSRKPVVEDGSFEDDQNRRDFTINTLAVSLNRADFGHLIDSFNGLSDLNDKIIRTPLDADITFSDDPLRMLRAIRFATQLGFQIHPDTWRAIIRNAHRIEIISFERITDELNKIMATPKPSVGFIKLHQAGLLYYFLPELSQLQGVVTLDGIGHKDNFYHTLQVLDNVSQTTNNLWLRWAALLHDIGKVPTKRFENGGWTFHSHEFVGAKMVKKVFTRLKLPLTEPLRIVEKLVSMHMRPISLTKEQVTDSAVRRLMVDAGEQIDELMLLCQADITSKRPEKVRLFLENYQLLAQKMDAVEEKDRLRCWEPPIDGNLIMETFGLSPSRMVGVIKTAIREAILDGIIADEYHAAYQYMLEIAAQHGLQPVNS